MCMHTHTLKILNSSHTPKSRAKELTPRRQIASDWLAGRRTGNKKPNKKRERKGAGDSGGSMKLSVHISQQCWQDVDWASLVISCHSCLPSGVSTARQLLAGSVSQFQPFSVPHVSLPLSFFFIFYFCIQFTSLAPSPFIHIVQMEGLSV